ncbi:MAG: 3-hydroxyacyl-CoA dehydrogenase family protein [Holophagaceae bacterium]
MTHDPRERAACRLVVAGPGAYGRSLAAWAARCGLDVRLLGRDRAHGEAGLRRIQSDWDRDVARGRLPAAQREEAEARLSAASSLAEALEGADAVLEALPEDLLAKAGFWRSLGDWPGLRLSGSSSIPMAAQAEKAGSGEAPLGFHGFVPVERMDVLELAVPEGAREERVAAAEDLAARLGRTVVRVRDQDGFAATRMALAQGLEAMRLLESGAADRDGIDRLMARGYGHPAGPLELSDRIGLDLRLAIARRLHAATGSPAFAPPAILARLVAEGRTGRAAGAGFYAWDPEGRKS